MKGIKLKITLILLMLVPVPFSCKDMNECRDDLYKQPYYRMLGMVFRDVQIYWRTPQGMPMFDNVSQDYDTHVYPCDSMALYFYVPDTLLMYHANHFKSSFSFTRDALACEPKRDGWSGTRDLVDKIYISSEYDFDETHNKNDNLSDIVDIFVYSSVKEEGGYYLLNDYNKYSPYQAPKRFYLLLKRKPTRSMTQQFVIRYNMKTEAGETNKHFVITTPVFYVR